MGNGLIAFFIAAGSGTWIYTKLMRNTGGNQQSSIIASGLIGALIFIVAFVVLGIVFK
jgi:hypothetical protein